MLELLNKLSAKMGAPDLILRERPPLACGDNDLAPTPPRASASEYASLAESIGFAHPHIKADLIVEEFKAFLRKKDWAIFSLPTVVAYMDKKAEEESAAMAGWHWRPLRAKDNIAEAHFGREAFRRSFSGGMMFHSQKDADRAVRTPDHVQTASDYYRGPHKERQMVWSNDHQTNRESIADVGASAAPYDKLVPLHALRKVAAIEAECPKPVSFFVCDYAPAPHIEYPDPFLMAVVNNAELSKGVGRFVIDFWDEPGFGLEQQLA